MNETIFTSDKSTLTVKRVFNAPLNMVWRAWTEAELLDQWWAPKPWKSETKFMEFKVGGHRIYAMVGPEGERHWGRSTYDSIEPLVSFAGRDLFCDENGEVNPELPVAHFTNHFHDQSEQTEVTIITVYESEEALQQIIEMGVKEGLSMAFENLDAVLAK